MADKAKMTEEEAYGLFTQALRKGQDALDRLPPEVKAMAMGPAETSLKPIEAEGYDVVVSPPEEPGPTEEFKSREEYKGFRMPKGMSPEQQDEWKSSIDEGLSKPS